MDSERKLRVRRDGPGWGVQAYYPEYGAWIFANDEPFALRADAIEFLQEGAPQRDWETDRREWARGLI